MQDQEPAPDAILSRPECAWITRDLEQKAFGHAIATVVPEHIQEVRGRRLGWIEKAFPTGLGDLNRQVRPFVEQIVPIPQRLPLLAVVEAEGTDDQRHDLTVPVRRQGSRF